MPSEQEIIDILRKLQANEPEKFREYIEFYKTKHTNFYKNSIEPVFRETLVPPVATAKPAKLVNPVDELDSEEEPLGSADIGAMPLEVKNDIKKPVTPEAEKIKRNGKGLKIAIVVSVVVVVIGAIAAAVYFLVL